MDGTSGGRARRYGAAAAFGFALALAPPSTVAEDRAGVPRGTSAVKPYQAQGLAPEAARKLQLGFDKAVLLARSVTQCGDLFRELGADPVDLLSQTRYYAAELTWGRPACPDGVFAATQVGSRVTMLCGGFGRVSRDMAAVVVLHEALHFAGLRERPRDPGAMSSNEINNLIRKSCGL
jgi:hypothetical protein